MDVANCATFEPESVAVRNVTSKGQEDIHGPHNFVDDITPIRHLEAAGNADVAVGLHVGTSLEPCARLAPWHLDRLVIEKIHVCIACCFDGSTGVALLDGNFRPVASESLTTGWR